MSISIDVRYQFAQGNPILFWTNRPDPYLIGSARTAHSGAVALVMKETNGLEGKPMIITFRLARKAHIDAWLALAGPVNPFNTTTLASYFNTGYKIILSPNNPIVPQNELIRDLDINQTIFDSSHGDYRKGFDIWRGQMVGIITGTV